MSLRDLRPVGDIGKMDHLPRWQRVCRVASLSGSVIERLRRCSWLVLVILLTFLRREYAQCTALENSILEGVSVANEVVVELHPRHSAPRGL